MKKLLVFVITLVLAMSCLSLLVGCNEESESNVETNVEYTYVKAQGTEGQEGYVAAHYVISGITVSSKDAEKLDSSNDNYDESFQIKDLAGNVVFDNKTKTLTVPTTYSAKNKEAQVTEIGMSAFANKNYIEKIVVSNNITKIGSGAFNGCLSLKEVDLPFIGETIDAVNEKKLFGYVFGETSNDTEKETSVSMQVNSSSGASSKTYCIPNTLEKVVIAENGMEKLPECSFYGISMVKEIVLPNTIKTVCKFAFHGCSSLTTIKMDAVVDIYEHAFADCSKLHDFDMANLENIGDDAFEGCTSLYSSSLGLADVASCTFTLGGKIKSVGEGAFTGCTGFVKLVVSSNVTFGANAFNGCTGLRYVEATGTVVAGTNMFKGCTALLEDNVSGISGDLGL